MLGTNLLQLLQLGHDFTATGNHIHVLFDIEAHLVTLALGLLGGVLDEFLEIFGLAGRGGIFYLLPELGVVTRLESVRVFLDEFLDLETRIVLDMSCVIASSRL